MKTDFVAALAELLLQNRIQAAIDALLPWLREHGSSVGAIADLLAACPAIASQRLIVLLADILTGYPRSTVGAPVLIFATPENRRRSPSKLLLPCQDTDAPQPGKGLKFLGWASAKTIVPEVWLQSPKHPVSIEMGQICAAVAVFESHQAPDEPLPAIGPEWWGHLFLQTGCCVSMTAAEPLLPYPSAVEAAQIMLDASRKIASSKHLELCYALPRFLGTAGQLRAIREGVTFGQSVGESL